MSEWNWRRTIAVQLSGERASEVMSFLQKFGSLPSPRSIHTLLASLVSTIHVHSIRSRLPVQLLLLCLQVDDVIKEGDAFIESRESPLVQRLAAWSGREPQVVTYGTNAGLPYGKDVAKSVVVFGPGDIAQAHQADEWVSLEELALHRAVMKKWMFE